VRRLFSAPQARRPLPTAIPSPPDQLSPCPSEGEVPGGEGATLDSRGCAMAFHAASPAHPHGRCESIVDVAAISDGRISDGGRTPPQRVARPGSRDAGRVGSPSFGRRNLR